MKKIFVTLLPLLCVGIGMASAQEPDPMAPAPEFDEEEADTIVTPGDDYSPSDLATEESQVSDGIDSLMSLWYVKKSLDTAKISRTTAEEAAPVFFSDSIYASVLKKIPTTFPLVYNEKVKNWIEMYLRRGKFFIPTILGLSKYYFPRIEEVLDQYGLPLELKYLTIVESALNPRAVSRAGATGLWQFMYGTGKMYDLKVTTLVDDRRDPDKETIAAAQLLKDMYAMYGDWALVIAAYNCGPGNVNKAIRRSGGKTDFWEIYPWLPKETRGYVPAFISVNYIMNNYAAHGYQPIDVNMPVYSDTVMVTNKLHFGQVSGVLGISVDELRELNPQYKKDIIPGDIEPAALRLPADFSVRFAAQEKEIYAYQDSIFFAPVNAQAYIRQATTHTSSSYRDRSYEPEPCDNSVPAGTSKLMYTVKQGDTFGFIANWYDVSVSKLKCWNNVYSNRINVGQKLTVYVPTKRLNTYKNIDNMTFAQKQSLKSNQIVQTSRAAGKNLDPNYEYYTIRKGDNLSTIASRYPGISDKDIMSINGFNSSDVRRLQIGQVIKIRKK
ncbi:MAG: LysM peptidoglycan-binding domain-containing protein [Bacteroidales bacterium]|nr:LysM peptidoglycan-binding domain-containing protein [Bacteroidales bacterium]